jgi:protein-export membrane protein SecD
MEGTKTRLQNLLVNKGYTEATVVREGETRIRVEVPDVDNPENIFDIIGKPATLRFIAASGDVIITGENVISATAGYDNTSGGYVVQLTLDSKGTESFREATSSDHTGEAISIVVTVDGQDQTISSPTVNDQIVNGKAIITGMADEAAAQNLADQITSGQFEVKLSLKESSTVSATLGESALLYGVIAGGVGLLLVMLFMCFFYRGFGGVAAVSLLIYMVLMFFFLATLPWVQLTLPGIAGIILSIGMAVDANVVIYERIKDEYRNGKSIKASTHAGFRKALWAILDSNITTIIAAIVLIVMGTGSIKGFGITLLVGIILSLFTAVVVPRSLCNNLLNINSINDKFYGLKRGDNYKDLKADESNAPAVEEVTADESAFVKGGELANEAN